jgi:hypothetical protein
MATDYPYDAIRVPSKLCKSPTAIGTFPHGGTALGMIARMVFSTNASYADIIAEEYGGTPVERIYACETPVFTCLLRGWDTDCIRYCFPNTTLGTHGRMINFSPALAGQNKPGYLGTNMSFKLLISPIAESFHPGLVIYNAVPSWDAMSDMVFKSEGELVLRLEFLCLPDSTGRVYQTGKLLDLSL